MTWCAAFIAQAKHDFAVFKQFNGRRGHISDQLHYLQMASEKLGRGFLVRPTDAAPPPMTHAGIVRMLQHLKGDPAIRRKFGYQSVRAFNQYIDSLLDIAARIQALAPAIAGTTQPNPEYPWLDKKTEQVIVPCQHDFADLGGFESITLTKFLKLMERLMVVIES